MANQRSESRVLTEVVGVRLSTSDLVTLREEAERRDMSVPRLLREIALGALRPAS